VNLKQYLKPILLLTGLGALAHGFALQAAFVYEDPARILNNPRTGSLAQAWELFDPSTWLQQPVLVLSYAFNRMFGDGPVGFHLLNIVIHLAVGVAFYVLAMEFLQLEKDAEPHATENPKSSGIWQLPFVAAALHMVHPLNVQAVAYLSDRGALLSTLFYLLSFFFYAQYPRQRERDSSGFTGTLYIMVSLLFFVLGFGTHASLITLPLMAILYMLMVSRDASQDKELKVTLGVLLPILLYMAYRVSLADNPFAQDEETAPLTLDQQTYALTQIKALTFYYVLKYLWPINLNFAPDVPLSGWTDPGLAFSLMFLYAVWWVLKRPGTSPLLRFGCIWIIITLLPTSSVVPLHPVVSESRFYLPGMGMHLITAWAILAVIQNRQRLRPMVIGMLVLLAVLSADRSRVFHSEIGLWQDVVEKSPAQPLAHLQLAAIHLKQHDEKEAERALLALVAKNTNNEIVRLQLGALYMKQKRYTEAAEHFDAVVKLGSLNPIAYYNLGKALVELGRGAEAVPYLDKVVRGSNLPSKFLFTLGRAYQQARQYEEALNVFRFVTRKDPKNALAFNHIGEVYWDMRNYFFADAAFQQAYDLDDASVPVLNNLISSNMFLHQHDEAIRYAQRLKEVDPGNDNADQWIEAALRLKNKKMKEILEKQKKGNLPVH